MEGRQGDGGRGGVPGSVGVSRGAAAPSAPLSENPQGQRRRGGHSLVSYRSLPSPPVAPLYLS